MIKLFIAEDEQIERRYLKKLINNTLADDVEIVGECNNGIEAIEKCLQLKPDIIIMDIHMPLKDGLEASKIIKNSLQDVEIIILTAFDYFDYAKEAIGIGVTDYLLKPYQDEKFCKVMNGVIHKIRTRIKKNEQVEKLKHQTHFYNTLMEKEIIISITTHEQLTQHQVDYFKDLGQEASYQCIVIETNSGTAIKQSLVDTIKHKLRFYSSSVMGYALLNQLIFILYGAKSIHHMATQLEDISKCLWQKDLEHKISIGNVHNNIYGIKTSYQEAMRGLHSNKDTMKHLPDDKMMYLLSTAEKEIFTSVIQSNTESATYELKAFIQSLAELGEDETTKIKTYFLQVCISLNKSMAEFFNNKIELKPVNILQEELLPIHKDEQLHFYMENYIYELSQKVKETKKTHNEKLVGMVKEYIKENYHKSLTLTDVADRFRISSHHLSRSFKRVDGGNFKDYLQQIRMEEAKTLIRDKGHLVHEVAYSVGFSNPNYFSKVFKKYTGISPKDYANM